MLYIFVLVIIKGYWVLRKSGYYNIMLWCSLFQSIKDIQLFALNGALALIVFLVLLAWEIIAPHDVVVRFREKEVCLSFTPSLNYFFPKSPLQNFVFINEVCFSQSLLFYTAALLTINKLITSLPPKSVYSSLKYQQKSISDKFVLPQQILVSI